MHPGTGSPSSQRRALILICLLDIPAPWRRAGQGFQDWETMKVKHSSVAESTAQLRPPDSSKFFLVSPLFQGLFWVKQ